MIKKLTYREKQIAYDLEIVRLHHEGKVWVYPMEVYFYNNKLKISLENYICYLLCERLLEEALSKIDLTPFINAKNIKIYFVIQNKITTVSELLFKTLKYRFMQAFCRIALDKFKPEVEFRAGVTDSMPKGIGCTNWAVVMIAEEE